MTSQASDKSAVMDAMRAAGATRAKIQFSGGGDEGGADQITVTYADAIKHDLPVYSDDELSQLLSDIVSWKYYSFADGGGFHVNGTITVDVAANTVTFLCYEETSRETKIEEEY